MSMKQFTKYRDNLLDSIPQFPVPDFASHTRLPFDSRKPEYQDEDIIEEPQSAYKDPFITISKSEWVSSSKVLERIFTGPSEETAPAKRHLEVGKSDRMFSSNPTIREMACGTVTIDIDSTLALFSNFSVINTVLTVSLFANQAKNLKKSVHLLHQNIPLHHIPHFHLGAFGHDIEWDLFVFLPSLYDKDIKRRRNNLHNHVKEDFRQAFIDKCLLPAVQAYLTPNEFQPWPTSYEMEKAKARAPGLEGVKFKGTRAGSTQKRTQHLDAKYISKVSARCNSLLARAIRLGDESLVPFKGLQFFINSKGHKDRTHNDLETGAGGFAELMNTFKEKVRNLTAKRAHRRLRKTSTLKK